MRAGDTSEKAASMQKRIHDALGPEGRMGLALQMSRLAREFAKGALRDECPTLTDTELTRELVRRLHPRSARTK